MSENIFQLSVVWTGNRNDEAGMVTTRSKQSKELVQRLCWCAMDPGIRLITTRTD